MYFILYLTERCNLACAYCDSTVARAERVKDWAYPLDELIAFLRQDPQLHLHFYGGEPLLRVDLMQAVLERTTPVHVCLQTNGLLLDQLPEALLERIDVVAVSIDGPAKITDAYRGEGTYARAVAQAQALRARGYQGHLDVRMTTSPGVSIEEAVGHFLAGGEGGDACAFRFDSIYWQLNVLFGAGLWRRDRAYIKRWFQHSYKPGITRLIDAWVAMMERDGQVRRVIPFACTMYNLLTGTRVEGVQCGAGRYAWTIATTGEVFACPVLRASPDFRAGTIQSLRPTEIQPLPGLLKSCAGCRDFGLCGGRCIYATESMRWGPDGFAMVCGATRQMFRELERVAPKVEQLIVAGRLSLEDHMQVGYDYEVIP